MAKQKCETCRFFQEAGLAGSGWCHHPQRKTSVGMIIMVRRSELACRNTWSASLWEPVHGAADETAPAVLHPLVTGPVPPANADDIRAVVSQDSVVHDAGEDVLLSEGRLIPEPVRPTVLAHQAPPPRPVQTSEQRSAVFKARDAYRERVRARDVAARQSEGIEPGRLQADLLDDATDGATQAQNGSWDDELDTGLGSDGPGSIPLPDVALGTTSETFLPVVFEGNEHSSLGDWLEQTAEPPEPVEPMHEEIRLDQLYEFANAPLPDWFTSELPKTCRTCRDFRPSLEGETGWCANRWAFGKALGEPLQLVRESEVIPCDSPFGNWWAAVDDVWMVAADVSHHSRLTPLMDRYLPAKTEEKKRS